MSRYDQNVDPVKSPYTLDMVCLMPVASHSEADLSGLFALREIAAPEIARGQWPGSFQSLSMS